MVIKLIQAIVIAAFLLAFATVKLKADTRSELELQVDVALALQRLNPSTLTPPPAPPAPPAPTAEQTDDRVTIYVIKAPFKCAPCDKCVKDTANKEFKEFKFDHKSPPKFQPESYPHLSWQDKSGKWYQVYGWSNIETFLQTYNSLMAKSSTFPKMTGYKQQVKVRGDLASHIVNDHGFAMPAGLTVDQMEALHDKLHGKSVPLTD